MSTMPDRKTYKTNLHHDLVNYVTLIMIADWVSRYSNSGKSLDNLAAGWKNRVEHLQKEAYQSQAVKFENDDDHDVFEIISELHIEFNRSEVVDEVATEFKSAIHDLLRQMNKPVGL